MKSEPAATREQVRELDRVAIQEYGIDGLILMENAGRWCARAAARMLGGAAGRKVAVVCGRGNNGGDGFVVTRHLSNWDAEVCVLLLGSVDEALAGSAEAAANLRIILKMSVPVRELASADEAAQAIRECKGADLIVDGLLGTGAQGEVREPFRSAIEALNGCGRPVLAIDVPSGLDANTGKPLGIAVRAVRTVTFAVNKVGFLQPGAEEYTGRVEVAEIGIPRAAIERLILPRRTASPRRPRRTDFDELSDRVIGCALNVHRSLGPGLLESAYEQCLAHELSAAGIAFRPQHPIRVEYKEVHLECGYRADLLVADSLLVEVKSVDQLLPIHQAQILTYMKLSGVPVGLLLNFNVRMLKDGIRRFVL
jgi:NAD(P)H-hydrate epimerase